MFSEGRPVSTCLLYKKYSSRDIHGDSVKDRNRAQKSEISVI